MHIFITGGSGFIGSAIVKELHEAGHQVSALARSAESAKKLKEMGAQVVEGDLEKLDVLKHAASQADAVCHMGFVHDFNNFEKSLKLEMSVIAAYGEALQGTNRPLLIASGTLTTADLGGSHAVRFATEDTPANANMRGACEKAALELASKGIRAMAVRFSPSVHGEGDNHGFITQIVNKAREKGVSSYIGNGENRWNAVHRLDAARLCRLALEKGTKGTVYHAVGDTAVSFKAIAQVIADKLHVKLVSYSPGPEAQAHFGFLAHFIGVDAPTSNIKTQVELGWHPEHPSLLEDLVMGVYTVNSLI